MASNARINSNERSAHHAKRDGYVEQTSFDESPERPLANDADDSFAGRDELPLDELVASVKVRNPSLQAAVAAWNAAANKSPQAVALDDPMFQSMYAPRSYSGDSNVQASHYFGVAQSIP